MTHSDLEALLEVEGRELLRRLLQAHLDERSPGTVAEPVIGADGRAHTHQRTQTRHLMTIFGEVEVTRTGRVPREHAHADTGRGEPRHDARAESSGAARNQDHGRTTCVRTASSTVPGLSSTGSR